MANGILKYACADIVGSQFGSFSLKSYPDILQPKGDYIENPGLLCDNPVDYRQSVKNSDGTLFIFREITVANSGGNQAIQLASTRDLETVNIEMIDTQIPEDTVIDPIE